MEAVWFSETPVNFYQATRHHIPGDSVLGDNGLEKFLTFYGTRMFITVFTRARHWSLS
jgi:hypothetical protein